MSLAHGFMTRITNGLMYFDPKLHTLEYVRRTSSFLLSVILSLASSYTGISPAPRLCEILRTQVARLEQEVIRKHQKSVEIVQAFLLLASWSDIPSVLCRDKTWMYMSRAIGLAIELRLESSVTYCAQTSFAYSSANHDILIRNAHRICYLLFKHDRVSTLCILQVGTHILTRRIWRWWLVDTQCFPRQPSSRRKHSKVGSE
jgi:hypothetical protein